MSRSHDRPRGSSLFVKNITDRTRPDELRELFGRFGRLRDVYIPPDYYTGRPRGFAYVQFEDARDAEDALYRMKRTRLHGRELSVEFALGDRNGEKRPTPHDMKRRRRDDSSRSPRRRQRSRSPRRRRGCFSYDNRSRIPRQFSPRRSPIRRSSPRRSPIRRSSPRRSPPRRSSPRRSPIRRSSPRRSPIRRSPIRRSPIRRSPIRRSPIRRSPLRRSQPTNQRRRSPFHDQKPRQKALNGKMEAVDGWGEMIVTPEAQQEQTIGHENDKNDIPNLYEGVEDGEHVHN